MLAHPFITSREGPKQEEDLAFFHDDDRGLFELRAILQAVLLHVERLLDGSTGATHSASSTLFGDITRLVENTNGNGATLKLAVIRQLMWRVLFGFEYDRQREGYHPSTHRMVYLAQQLYLTQEMVLTETVEFIDGISMENGAATPAKYTTR